MPNQNCFTTFIDMPNTKFLCATIIALLLFCNTAEAQRETSSTPQSGSAAESLNKTKRKRIREGTNFTRRLCTFQQVGPRLLLTFETKGDSLDRERFFCLENQQLERVSQTIQERTTQVYWWVDGTYTEFRGNNYIIVQRVQQAPQSALETLK